MLTGILAILHFVQDGPTWKILFILFAVLERIYETFYTGQGKTREQLNNDWPLLFVVFSYMVAFFGAFFESYLVPRRFFYLPVFIGLVCYGASLILRWSAIHTLGKQWNIHSQREPSFQNLPILIRKGPYRYLRHPYYLGACIEIVSIPLVMTAWYSLAFAVLVVCPVEIFRGFFEERYLVTTFGWPYLKYRHERGAFFPLKKPHNYDRRKISVPISFPDRRIPSCD